MRWRKKEAYYIVLVWVMIQQGPLLRDPHIERFGAELKTLTLFRFKHFSYDIHRSGFAQKVFSEEYRQAYKSSRNERGWWMLNLLYEMYYKYKWVRFKKSALHLVLLCNEDA